MANHADLRSAAGRGDYLNGWCRLAMKAPQDLIDDPEECRARYVDAYCKAYAEQITQMRQEQRQNWFHHFQWAEEVGRSPISSAAFSAPCSQVVSRKAATHQVQASTT